MKQGGLDFGYDPDAAYQVVKRSKDVSSVPIFGKLAPDYSSLVPVAQAIEAAGADAISMINGPRAMCIDYRTRKPILGNKIGTNINGAATRPMVAAVPKSRRMNGAPTRRRCVAFPALIL